MTGFFCSKHFLSQFDQIFGPSKFKIMVLLLIFSKAQLTYLKCFLYFCFFLPDPESNPQINPFNIQSKEKQHVLIKI